jgi:hypothetical protein
MKSNLRSVSLIGAVTLAMAVLTPSAIATEVQLPEQPTTTELTPENAPAFEMEAPQQPLSESTFELPDLETRADLLTPAAPVAQTFPSPEEATPDPGEVEPGRPTRSGSSYVGIGGNFGTVGDSSVGDSGLIIYSKIGLTRFFSVRPAIATDFSEDATFLLPATLDFRPIAIGSTDISLAPYIGGGAALTTNGDFGPLVVGGIDVPITSKLTATAGVNAGILDPVDVGVFVGIGYNFPGF